MNYENKILVIKGFQEVPESQIDELRDLLDELNLEWEFQITNKDGKN